MDRVPGAPSTPDTARGSTGDGGPRESTGDREPRECTDRRTVLRRGGLAIAATLSLAGCTEDVGEELPPNEHWPTAELVPGLPVRRRADVLEDGIEELSSVEIDDVDGFVAALEDRGFAFAAVDEIADQLRVEYAESEPGRQGTFAVLGPVAGGYAALVDAGVEPRALELVLYEPDGATIGVAEIATEWAEAYNEGALTTGEYGELVAGTIESLREPPEPDVAPE